MKSKIHAGSFNKDILKKWDKMGFLRKAAVPRSEEHGTIITLHTFFTWFAGKKNRRCTADIQRKPEFLHKSTYCQDNSNHRPLFRVGFWGPHFRPGSELSVRDQRCWQRAMQFSPPAIGSLSKWHRPNPTSRQLRSGEMAPTVLQMKKQMWQNSTRVGKRDRWLERARDRLEGKEIHKIS